MNEESSNGESPSAEKLSIDNPSDFQFHAAFLAYSDIYDKTAILETRRQLNQNIKSLQEGELDYTTFYRNLSKYREEAGSRGGYDRARIKTQKKREWRRKAQKRERNKRHRK